MLQTGNLPVPEIPGNALYQMLIAFPWRYKWNNGFLRFAHSVEGGYTASVREARTSLSTSAHQLAQTSGLRALWAELGAGQGVHQQPQHGSGMNWGQACTRTALGWAEMGLPQTVLRDCP